MKPGARSRRAAAWLLLVACHERQPASGSAVASPPVEAPSERVEAPAIPEARRCGEAGALPTELPPALAAGRAAAQEATLTPDATSTIGTVVLRYERSTWIGTMRAGHSGPALIVEIDRAEAGGGPWGAIHELHADQQSHVLVGPYRIDLRSATGEPPAHVTVAVRRDVCPAAAVIEPSPEPRWLWLSTEGIRLHTYDLQGELLQLALDVGGDVPRLDVSTLGYRQWLEPRPGAPRTVYAGGHAVTIERVVAVPKVSLGDGRLHVLAKIAAAPPTSHPDPAPATSPCGDAGPARTSVPGGIAAVPAEAERREIEPGQRGTFGALGFEYTMLEIPAHGGGPYREEARSIPMLQFLGDPASSGSATGPFTAPRLVRGARELLRIEPVAGGAPGRVRVRRFALTCPKEHVLTGMPAYVWLSTLGHSYVTIGAPPERLTLQIYDDPAEPSLGLGSEHAYLSQRIHPGLVGRAFSLDGRLVEIVDVQATDGTRGDGARWQTEQAAPAVHVQVRISAAPPT